MQTRAWVVMESAACNVKSMVAYPKNFEKIWGKMVGYTFRHGT